MLVGLADCPVADSIIPLAHARRGDRGMFPGETGAMQGHRHAPLTHGLRYRELKFGALSEDAYRKLADEVTKAKS